MRNLIIVIVGMIILSSCSEDSGVNSSDNEFNSELIARLSFQMASLAHNKIMDSDASGRMHRVLERLVKEDKTLSDLEHPKKVLRDSLRKEPEVCSFVYQKMKYDYQFNSFFLDTYYIKYPEENYKWDRIGIAYILKDDTLHRLYVEF